MGNRDQESSNLSHSACCYQMLTKMKHYCAKPSGIMLTQLATKCTHTYTVHTLYTLARMMPVKTVSYYICER